MSESQPKILRQRKQSLTKLSQNSSTLMAPLNNLHLQNNNHVNNNNYNDKTNMMINNSSRYRQKQRQKQRERQQSIGTKVRSSSLISTSKQQQQQSGSIIHQQQIIATQSSIGNNHNKNKYVAVVTMETLQNNSNNNKENIKDKDKNSKAINAPKGAVLIGWGQLNKFNIAPVQEGLKQNYRLSDNIPKKLATNVLKISSGQNHIVYINNKYQAYGLGQSIFGQLGYSQPLSQKSASSSQSSSSSSAYQGIAIPILQQLLIQQVFCTPFCTFLITNRDQVYGCGINNRGQLGIGNSDCVTTPVKIGSLSRKSLISNTSSSALKKTKSQVQQSYPLFIQKQKTQQKLLTQKSQSSNPDIYLNTVTLQTHQSNEYPRNSHSHSNQHNKQSSAHHIYQVSSPVPPRVHGHGQFPSSSQQQQSYLPLLQSNQFITCITGGPYHTIALSNKGRVFYTGNIYKKSSILQILTNEYTNKFSELNIKKIGKVHKIKSGITCIGLLNTQGYLFILGVLNQNVICDQPYNVGLGFVVDFGIMGDRVYVLCENGDVWGLKYGKKCMKLSKMVIEGEIYKGDFGKIVGIQASIDYCLFFSQKGVVFGEGNNYGNILGQNVINKTNNLSTRVKEKSDQHIQNYNPILYKIYQNIKFNEIKVSPNFIVALCDKFPSTIEKYQDTNRSNLKENMKNEQNRQSVIQTNKNQDLLLKRIQDLQKQNKALKNLMQNQSSNNDTKSNKNIGSARKKDLTSSTNLATTATNFTKKSTNIPSSQFQQSIIPQSIINKARKFTNSLQIPFEQLELGKQISEGGYGIIYKALWRKTTVAVKIFKIDFSSQNSVKDFVSECHAMQVLRHPNIVMFLGACTKPPNFAIVLQYCQGGTLWSILQKTGELSWEQRRRFALDTARGMNYLHERPTPILHRDLKSLNLLLDQNKRIKLADFGWTKGLQNYMTGKIGTYQWMAPQVVSSHQYTQKADVFSFAIILWEIASREAPYRNIPGVQVAQDVLHKDLRPTIPKKCPQSFASLMKKCWHKNPESRPSFCQIIDQLEKMDLPN